MRTTNYRRSVLKDIKKLDKKAKELFLREIADLTQDLSIDKPLKGSLKGYYSRAFISDGISYRIIYSYDDVKSIISVEMVGSRENIYKIFKQRI